MSVRLSLLAILDEGPCYGYQLRTEYERRTSASGLNVGQIYTTLERLERDGLVAREGADARGHVYWGITDAGSREARSWLARPDERATRDELAHKLALAATLPAADAATTVAVHRSAAAERVAALSALDPVGAPAVIVHAAALAHARADLAWLDVAAGAVAAPASSRVFGLSSERPRRGRPARRDEP